MKFFQALLPLTFVSVMAAFTSGSQSALGQGAPNANQLVRVSVYAAGPDGDNTYRPGEPTTVIFHFAISPGWHTYWLNPGDSGQSTAVKLNLPKPAGTDNKEQSATWTQGPTRLSIPKTIPQPGGLVNYGYENEMVLITTVTPPPDATGPVELSAYAVFLVCQEVCLPGHQKVKITLSPKSQASPGTRAAEELERWKPDMPAEKELGAELKGGPVTDREWSALEATLTVPDRVSKAEFFPLVSDELDVRRPSVEVKGGSGQELVIKTESKLYSGTVKAPATLSGLLVLTQPDGKRQGHWISLALRAATNVNSAGSTPAPAK